MEERLNQPTGITGRRAFLGKSLAIGAGALCDRTRLLEASCMDTHPAEALLDLCGSAHRVWQTEV